MHNVSLFCKSYRPDLERVSALAESVRAFNVERLNFTVGVPSSDLSFFRNKLGSEGVEWVTDEDVVAATGPNNLDRYQRTDGYSTQQVIKAEFWRLNIARNYLCIDSDCKFIRRFGEADFLAADGNPYTVIHEGKSFRQFCAANGLTRYVTEFDAEKTSGRELFRRVGPNYQFGPLPTIWSAAVWKSLHENYLGPKNLNMFDAIETGTIEATWYGEALLAYGAVPIYPREPLFKAYLYLEEYEADRRSGIDEAFLARDYFGVVYQSNWYPKRVRGLKNISYKIKKFLRVFRSGH
jgi:hypothetical protein